jgi:hypothetical protein
LLSIIENEIFNVKQDSPEVREYWSSGVLKKIAHGAGNTVHSNTIVHRDAAFSLN